MIRVAVAAPVCATLSHLGVCRFVLPARPLRVTGPHLRRYLRRTGRTNPVLGRVPSWYPWSQGMDEAPRCGRPPPEAEIGRAEWSEWEEGDARVGRDRLR